MKTLVEIANKHGSDKGTVHGQRHSYAYIYDLLFASLRARMGVVTVCEIGLMIPAKGSGPLESRVPETMPSAMMWRDCFKSASVHGIDISDFSRFDSHWFKYHKADTGERDQVTEVAKRLPGMDVIIDDGSHASYDQQVCFIELFGNLRPGAFYVIEDLDYQPQGLEKSRPPSVKTSLVFANPDADNGPLGAEIKALSEHFRVVVAVDDRTLEMFRHSPHDARRPIATILTKKRTKLLVIQKI